MAASKILILTTSHAKLGDTDTPTGFWLEEFAAPYVIFREAGVEVDVASIKGGRPPVDPKSEKDLPPLSKKFLETPEYARALENTLKLSEVDLDQYKAIFIPGGHGVVFDLPVDDLAKKTVEAFYNSNRFVASVCHGPAGIVTAVDTNGKPIVAGKKVTGFTNSEEEAVGLTKVVPFLLESRLKELGGHFESGPNWAPYVVRDGNLITGQNPASSEEAAKILIEALKASA